MIILWYLDGDSSMEIKSQKLKELDEGTYKYAIKVETKKQLEVLEELFWKRELGLSDKVYESLAYYFSEFIHEVRSKGIGEYYQGNYYIKCIEELNVYEV